MKIILASSSKSRKKQLENLGFTFTVCPSDINESVFKESKKPADICQQLAQAKVEKVAKNYPDSLILGGDQVAALGDKIFNKPMNDEKAVKTLMALQGKTHQLFTALYMRCQKKSFAHLEVHSLQMRTLSEQQIKTYVQLAKPLYCAGSYALERYGIALFQKINTQDQSGIIGFPLIALMNQLIKWNIPIPCFSSSKEK